MTRPVGCLFVCLTLCGVGPGADPPSSVPDSPAPTPGSRYYILLFGSDAGPLSPGKTHTFATYVKAAPAADGSVVLEPVTVSWLPADLRVKPLQGLRTEPGRNVGLHETIEVVRKQGQAVALWGPYETDAGRYEAAVRQVRTIESGEYRYRAIPPFAYKPGVSNCIGTVVRTEPSLSTRRPPAFRYGQTGSKAVADWLEKAGAIDRSTTHDWLIPALGLDRYELVRKK